MRVGSLSTTDSSGSYILTNWVSNVQLHLCTGMCVSHIKGLQKQVASAHKLYRTNYCKIEYECVQFS